MKKKTFLLSFITIAILVITSCTLTKPQNNTCFDAFKFTNDVPNKYGIWDMRIVQDLSLRMCLPETFWQNVDATNTSFNITVLEEGLEFFPPFETSVPFTEFTIKNVGELENNTLTSWIFNEYSRKDDISIKPELGMICEKKGLNSPDFIAIENEYSLNSGNLIKFRDCSKTAYVFNIEENVYLITSFYGFDTYNMYEELMLNILRSVEGVEVPQ